MRRKIFALVRSLIFGAAFVSIWVWLVPRWLSGGELKPQFNAAAIGLMIIGAVIAIRCVFDFAWRGLGTPAPFDPPRRLVVTGPYRWVRNPMYLGLGIFFIGEAILLPDITTMMLIVAGTLWGIVTIFIIMYEEPTLRRQFGADYELYREQVHRWWPRLTPFDKAKALPYPHRHLD